ncbi:MAG: UvrD-helicase domain-containing protein, partial [Gammaproteobacteria bacterium]
CQDTDPLQWKVFRRIYPRGALFFVGDPKQSIYAFRGADVFAYLAAARAAEGRLTLDVNRRATPALIGALNGLFSLRGDRVPFGTVDIDWREVECPPRSTAEPLRLDGTEQDPLQIIRRIAPDSGGKAAAQRLLAEASADHLARMLCDARAGRLLLGDRPVEPADIACLVRTRKQAELLARELGARGVPSVFASRDSVYESPVAADLHRLLLAVLEPRSERHLRSVLGSALAGRSAAELEQCFADEQQLQVWQQRFVDWRGELGRRGVQAILRTGLLSLGVPERLLARPGGERQLADCLHLIELLGAERESLDSDEALAARLAALIAHPAPQREEQQLRLESDARRLRISTIHASKGLEYPIVCMPFVHSESRSNSSLYHDPRTGQAIYDLSEGAASRE